MKPKRDVRMKTLEGMLKDEYQDGFQNGVAEGLAVAERIFVWWYSNQRLAVPHKEEKLVDWSQNALSDLRSKLE